MVIKIPFLTLFTSLHPQQVKNVFHQSNLFFELDELSKKKYAKPPVTDMSSWYGYTSPGQENAK